MSGPQENGLCSAEEEEEEEDEEAKLERARDRRRAKSLPAYPDLPLRALSRGCRKSVRFADALGLSLASVKHFSAAEEPRVPVPVSVPVLGCALGCSPPSPPPLPHPLNLPVSTVMEVMEVEERVRRCGLALERVTVSRGRVHGTLRVSTGALDGDVVGVRYTLDGWRTFEDARADPVHALNGTRRFAFSFTVTETGTEAVHFALYLRPGGGGGGGGGGEFWDNNDGQNYTLRPV